MKWQLGRRGGIEDRRGKGAAGALGGGSIGLAIIAMIAYFVFGVDPQTVMNAGQQMTGATSEQGSVGTPEDEAGAFADVVHTSANDIWAGIFKQSGETYRPSRLVLYTEGTSTACGFGQAAMGPFYCPGDETVYIDLGFFETLDKQLGAPGDFAKAYVIGHEVGHHVQTVTGVSRAVSEQQRSLSKADANALSVKQELQADCYAGIWARLSDAQLNWLEEGDLEEGIRAASAVGDDTLQKAQTGQVVPDSFTHGSSEQRMQWFRRGYNTGNVSACDTFARS